MWCNPIICALDTYDINHALRLTKMLYGKISMVKLGLEFFTAHGLSGVQAVSDCGIPIFLDLKLHDIPNTVGKAISVIKSLNIAMLTIHISGGRDMMLSAIDSIFGSMIKLIGVTVLTSIDDSDLKDIGIDRSSIQHVMLLSKVAQEIGLYGIVCSAFEVQEVRNQCGKDFKLVVPGIRFEDDYSDQKRVKNPKDAILAGADYLVIGRPITMSSDPIQTVDAILSSINL
ncbi:orotidine-5'-phosphate decarboxylase [Ehrlichia canis]|uniref:Orotidine 5'-phosphate decarboxylase n=1 Tax=Ehrlichia canis (strain Jake) TaxID=269484 RepID=PYRF_EHRCJ|nr:orotidine-5'-phosphate decarboxylase [Ehrlichia canis]Q3YSH4.1 RecName: Full=Orotidine 5'-phosphate decarboxylase; AltName: Full=OMP decarboxylase; Short=OMPDCase; Short=OMPdecase [Ehrlichia canis str. Jake]AAZ68331.1 orotidine-5'-phosphate decarboxylase [Ehrlichia canis str. Jake]AUO54909.1 orotidine-5'-phosphate decarboxylase [Ehrlichia canis]UKC53504.1 pyrF [Ehrlichia canis]UKC54443.1 pyrF [Ehrlichia canis]UKC55379.1 pyrF [Ehrlichia canis]